MSFVTDMFRSVKAPQPLAPPDRSDPAVEEARRRALIAEGKSRGPAANYLTGGSKLGAPPVAQKYLTGT